MQVNVTTDNLKFFQCFSSQTRLKIIELIQKEPKNIGELATTLDLSSTIIARHVSMLESAGVVNCENVPGKRGLQRKCSLNLSTVTLDFLKPQNRNQRIESISIPIGHYSNYEVWPTCGLSSTKGLIGMLDDQRYFSNPEKINAGIIWLGSGWLEYTIPSYIFSYGKVHSLEISMEISSEYPGYKDIYPSDILFVLNNIELGYYTAPGNYGSVKGKYTPKWFNFGSEYGLLKTLRITTKGTYLDGDLLSTITLKDLAIDYQKDMTLRIASPSNVEHPGGLTIFGQGFGNYDQNLEVRVLYNDTTNS